MPPQFVSPGPHVVEHVPPEQTVPGPQTLVHEPQRLGSVERLAHVPLQFVRPLWQLT